MNTPVIASLATAASDEIPHELKISLAEYDSISKEIANFVKIINID